MKSLKYIIYKIYMATKLQQMSLLYLQHRQSNKG